MNDLLDTLKSATYLITEGYLPNVLSDLFINVAVEKYLQHFETADWRSDLSDIPSDFGELTIVRSYKSQGAWQVLALASPPHCGPSPVVIYIAWAQGRINVSLAGQREACVAELKKLREKWPELPPAEDRIRVTNWAYGRNGGQRWERQIDAPEWLEIEANYAQETTLPGLNAMMHWKPPTEVSGHLILWHGKTGGGKTWAIRCLARAWRDWCELHYISDPETLFGSKPSYLMQVAMNEDSSYAPGSDEDLTAKWRLVVLEDCGEMLSSDAKERVGQGLSRLLNLSDGLLGQGVRILLLVTTNEELGRLHPAVQRAGRCIAQVNFEPLGWWQAAKWLQEHGRGDTDNLPTRSYMLADLYQLLHSDQITTPVTTVGFHPPA